MDLQVFSNYRPAADEWAGRSLNACSCRHRSDGHYGNADAGGHDGNADAGGHDENADAVGHEGIADASGHDENADASGPDGNADAGGTDGNADAGDHVESTEHLIIAGAALLLQFQGR